ncbi:MAG: putative zinc-binding protein [Armatimonadota bacterium]
MSECRCDGRGVLIFACSGASNVGQIANEVAKRLHSEGYGTFSCLAGIAGEIPGMVASARAADAIIVLDGCSVACARAVLERAGMATCHHQVVADLGVRKNHSLEIDETDIERVYEAVRAGAPAVVYGARSSTDCCGCGCECESGCGE